MSIRPLRALAAVVAVGGLLAVPASATAANTAVSFTVASSGGLAISQSGGSSTLTNAGNALEFNAALPGTVTGNLPQTTVTDTRGVPAGAWAVSVVATGNFVNGGNPGISVPASAGRVYMPATSIANLTSMLGGGLSGMVVTGAELTAGTSNLAAPYTLIQGTSTLGNGSVVYTPAVSVTVPAATPAGTYTTTVQQTVS